MKDYKRLLLVLSLPETSILVLSYFIILFRVNAIFSGRFCFYMKSCTEKVCKLYWSYIYMYMYIFMSFKTYIIEPKDHYYSVLQII